MAAATPPEVLQYWAHALLLSAVSRNPFCVTRPHWQLQPTQALGPLPEPLQSQCREYHDYPFCYAPQIAKHQQNWLFLPYVLLVSLNESGQLVPWGPCPLPLFSRQATEPMASGDLIIAAMDTLDNTMTANPPPWQHDPAQLDLCAQTRYAEQVLVMTTSGAYSDWLTKVGYTAQETGILAPVKTWLSASDLEQLARLHPKQADAQAKLSAQLTRALDPIPSETTPTDATLPAPHPRLCLQPEVVLNLPQRQVLQYMLTGQGADCQTCEAPRGTGKSSLIRLAVAELWLQAALDNQLPPVIGWANGHAPQVKAQLFNCTPPNLPWVMHQVGPNADKIKTFLQLCGQFLGQPIQDLSTAVKRLKQRLHTYHDKYQAALQQTEQWLEFENNLQLQYVAHGGIGPTQQHIQQKLARLNAKAKQLARLEQLAKPHWQKRAGLFKRRPLEGAAPPGHRTHLEKLFEYFLPEQTVTGLTVAQLQALLQSSQQTTIDAIGALLQQLDQLQADRDQQQQLQAAAVTSLSLDASTELSATSLQRQLNQALRAPLLEVLVHYWEARTLMQQDWQPDASLASQFSLTPPEYYDWIVLEAAEQIPPHQVAGLYACCRRMLVFGHTLAPTATYLTAAADRYLASALALYQFEEDLEDLEYSGLLLSCSSGWQLLRHTHGESMQLTHQWDMAPKLLAVFNNLFKHNRLIATRDHPTDTQLPNLGYFQIGHTSSEPYQGSVRNVGESQVIAQWVNNHIDQLEATSGNVAPCAPLCIVTPYTAQKMQLQADLQRTGQPQIPVQTFYELKQTPYRMLIVSLVHTGRDSGPFLIDTGETILARILQSACDHCLFFGDLRLFNPNHNSPSGQLAHYLFSERSNQLNALNTVM